MELHVKPEDKIYDDVNYLIENKQVCLKLTKLFEKDAYRRDGLYCRLYEVGFLEKEGHFNLLFSPGRHEILEDKTIVLYNRLKEPRSIFIKI